MPELPDIETYIACLRRELDGARLERVRITSPSILRTVEPPTESLEGSWLRGAARIGKRIAMRFEDASGSERWAVLHLMIAGRLRWTPGRGIAPGRAPTLVSAEFGFDRGTLSVTEASKEKRATLHVVADRRALEGIDPGGIEPLTCSRESFARVLLSSTRTLKRALTDPHAFAGIGNAYSDEILHAARLSPTQRTTNLDAAEVDRLFDAARTILTTFRDRLAKEFAKRFPGPGAITAFRPDFAVHGKFEQPCPVCGTTVQRIVRGAHETNYCPRCQTGGKVLADHSLSRLLGEDWPSRVEEWE